MLTLVSLQGIKQRKASSCPALIREGLFLDIVFGSMLLGETSSRKIRALPGPWSFLKSQDNKAQQSCGKEDSKPEGVSRGMGSVWRQKRNVNHTDQRL